MQVELARLNAAQRSDFRMSFGALATHVPTNVCVCNNVLPEAYKFIFMHTREFLHIFLLVSAFNDNHLLFFASGCMPQRRTLAIISTYIYFDVIFALYLIFISLSNDVKILPIFIWLHATFADIACWHAKLKCRPITINLAII